MPRWEDRPVVDGVELAPNLFRDAQKRPGKYRYRKPDGKFTILKGTLTPRQANAIALAANAKVVRGEYSRSTIDPKAPPAKGSWGDLAERYIAHKERLQPDVIDKRNWINMRAHLRQFGRDFADIAPHRIGRPRIVAWWDELSHHQQNKRHTELRRLFNWAMGEGYCPQLDYNPFTTNDDRPRLYMKSKPEKERSAITLRQFWETYHRAGNQGYIAVQRAMAISLVTTMRVGDICKLRFDQVTVADNQLRVVIGKSEAQRGAALATRLAWSLDKIPLLRDVITEAREGSLKARRCPFIVYHLPERERDYSADNKEHPFQTNPNLIAKQFRKVRPDVPNPPTFHEIRALSSVLYAKAGYDIEKLMLVMAHNRDTTTRGYQDYGDLPYVEVDFGLTAEDIGGTF